MTHLRRFQEQLAADTAALISSPQHIFYLCNFKFSDGYLLISKEKAWLLTDFRYAGRIRFDSDVWPSEIMHLYHATGFVGDLLSDCNEGNLAWVDKKRALTLPMWEGDRLFLERLDAPSPFFHMILRYEGERLAESTVGDETLPLE